ncbi:MULTISPECIES: DUF3987 domain-containing protein [unclassified Streptomyces]|uniref:DUF3987 domain-containing protein n=1 Tax=unclassified Streptomyces TaxID=2593676 RepID=UPI00381DD51F
MTTLESAQWLINHSFPVFPCDHPGLEKCAGVGRGHDAAACEDRGKHPAVAFTRTYARDPERVKELFGNQLRNVGVPVGACSGPEGEQLVVLDSDRIGAIEDTAVSLGQQHTPTMRVRTAKGYHDYYWAPAEAKIGNRLGALQGKFDGDVRAGNAYVIGPGSVHASGVVYELEDAEQPPVLMPNWLLEALQARTAAPSAPGLAPVIPLDRHDAYTRKALQAECDAIVRAPNGDQNNAINRAAFSIGTLVAVGALSEADAQGALLAAARAGNHPEGRARSAIESGLTAGAAKPRHPWPPITELTPQTRTAPLQNDSSNSSEELWGPEDTSAGISGTENEGGGPCWDPPIPVPEHKLPPFPTDLLGASLANWVRAQGAALNVSDDLLALSALASISAALGGRVQVRVKDGWEAENVCLYCLGLADSSARKTPALDAAMAPMRERIGKFRDDLRAEVEENEQMIRITEKELAAVENDVSRGKKTQDDARAVLDTLRDLRDQPALPKAFVGDVTLEALGKVMGENGGRMALMESEAGFFKACAGLYGNGRADITLVLKAFSGTGHEIDRVGRGNSWMPRTALTLALIIQPGVVEHLEKENPEFKSSGFLNRFLYALPTPMPPGTFDTPGVPVQVAADYAQRLVRLVDDIWDSENIRTLTLTATARKVFADFYNQIEQDKVDGGKLHDIAEWAGKLCGQVIRLSACLALYENPSVAEIDENVMERATGLAPYLIGHARAAFALMSRDGDGGRKLLRDILERLAQLLDDDNTVTLRKIRESFKGRRSPGGQGAVDAELIKDAMDELEDLGWVSEIPAPPRKPGQRGQKPSPKYDVHPWVYAPPREAS